MAANSSPSEFIGQVLQQRYRIDRLLGQKTGRRTFLAQDLQSNEQVAIKLLIFNSEFVWDDLKLFEREAGTLKNLHHPAIPQYRDYFEFDLPTLKGFALVQNYIPAPSLEEAFQQGRRFTEADMQELASTMLDILDYLHQFHPPIIHRDIKPSNILIADRTAHSIGSIYLIDFGSVQNAGVKEGGTMTVVGTYGYMPIEQFGSQTVPASDLYSLGATLIYLIQGIHPSQLPQQDGRMQLPTNRLSPNYQRWLKQMVEPNLQRRFTSVAAARQALLSITTNALPTNSLSYQTNSLVDGSLSKMSINKKPEFIEANIPDPQPPIPWWLALLLSFLVLPGPVTLFANIIGGYSVIIPVLIFSPVIYNIWYRYNGRRLIRIDQRHFTLQSQSGIFAQKLMALGARNDIEAICYYPRTTHNSMDVVTIAAAGREYPVYVENSQDAQILHQELSEWLGLQNNAKKP
jgi:serine/threonine protein kinase